jgi:hypothetical protein
MSPIFPSCYTVDLIAYDGSQVNPECSSSRRPQCRVFTIHWVNFHKPSRKHMVLWNGYINIYIQPCINASNISWNTKSKPHYNTNHFLCHRTGKLLEKVNIDTYNVYEAIRGQPGSRTTTFHITPSSTITNHDTNKSLQPVEVTHSQHHVTILCPSNINNHGPQHIYRIHS